jgi:hypothetical protein
VGAKDQKAGDPKADKGPGYLTAGKSEQCNGGEHVSPCQFLRHFSSWSKSSPHGQPRHNACICVFASWGKVTHKYLD